MNVDSPAKRGAPPLFGEGCCKFKECLFFFSTLTSVTAIQESVLYLHGDTLPGIVTKKSTEENCSMHNLVGWIRSLFYSF